MLEEHRQSALRVISPFFAKNQVPHMKRYDCITAPSPRASSFPADDYREFATEKRERWERNDRGRKR
jgi:hypothetical protein